MQQHIPLAQIDDSPHQTRTAYDEAAIAELANDILANGLHQAPVARRTAEGRYQLAFGHRRLRAFRRLLQDGHVQFATMPLDIRDLTDEAMAVFAWSENAQRRDISPIEQAHAIQRMIEAFGWTQDQVAERLGLSRPTVANKLRLLRLPEKIQTKLSAGGVSERQASALLPLTDLPAEFVAYADRKDTPGYCRYKPSELIERAAQLSSDEIRHLANEIVTNKADPMDRLPPDLLAFAFGQKGYLASVCNECPIRIRQGNRLYCGRPDCLKDKQRFWAGHRLREAANATGIPVVDGDGNLRYGTYEDLRESWELTGLQELGCRHLRLRPNEYAGMLNPDGYPDIRICVYWPDDDHKCKHIAAVRSAHTRAHPDPAEVAKRAAKAAVNALVDEAARALSACLVDDQPGAWRFLLQHALYGQSGGSATATSTQLRLQLATALVRSQVPWQGEDKPDIARKAIGQAFIGADLPDPFPPAEAQPAPAAPVEDPDDSPLGKLRHRLERVLLWIERSRTGGSSVEAVQGNIDNLYKIKAELCDPAIDLPAGDPILDQLHDAHEELTDWLTRGLPGSLARAFATQEATA